MAMRPMPTMMVHCHELGREVVSVVMTQTMTAATTAAVMASRAAFM